MKLLRNEVAFGSEAAFGCEVASQWNGAEGGAVTATLNHREAWCGTVNVQSHHNRAWCGTVIRLPLTRELSAKVTEGESYNALLLTFKSNKKLGISPSVTRGRDTSLVRGRRGTGVALLVRGRHCGGSICFVVKLLRSEVASQ